MAYSGKYQTPAELLNDENLSHDEKVEMLESWRDDKEAYMRASDEGMHAKDHSVMLKQINKALTALEEKSAEQ